MVTATAARAADALPALTVPVLAAAPATAGIIDASWSSAAPLELSYDFTYKRAPKETTRILVAQDGDALDVAVDARQSETITATQHTNGGGVLADDNLTVLIWPQGIRGFAYSFSANPLGTRYQTSSENSAYAPQWTAAGARTPGGYSLTMRIPFAVVRSGGSRAWQVQFVRNVVATGAADEWAHVATQQSVYDPLSGGMLSGLMVKTASARPAPRLQVYALEQIARPAGGGSTARLGGDLALPMTPTSSLLATFHPDYSNVEVDQQSISPLEFARQYQEVRPFFTQAGSNFNAHFSCFSCPTTLYTPAIPTFRAGYAIEGTQGHLTFGALDAVGFGRSDTAQVVNYIYSDPRKVVQVSEQRVAVDLPGLHDDVLTTVTGYQDVRSHAAVWYNTGTDAGTNVTDRARATYHEVGGGAFSPTGAIGIEHQHVGAQFLPVDGFVAHPDIDGLTGFGNRTFTTSPTAFVRSVFVSGSFDHYRDHTGALDQTDASAYVQVNTRTLFALSGSIGSSYLLVPDLGLTPFNQNGVSLSYRAGTSTPISTSYYAGRYYRGELRSSYTYGTVPLTRRLRLSLEGDRTSYTSDAGLGADARQWLERASLSYQLDRQTSFSLGARRIVGISAPSGFSPPQTVPVNAGNLSFAFHRLALRNELYVVYGDPNSLATRPVIFLKLIHYLGAPKGT